MDILPRAWWGARPPARPYVYFDDHKYVGVEAHHSVTNPNEDFATAMYNIQAGHLARGWTDIFYSFAIYKDGRIAEGRGWNKSQGSDTTWDPDGSGPKLPGKLAPVVFIGNYDTSLWTQAQLDSWNWLHREMLKRSPSALNRRYHGMRAATACPGATIKSGWDRFADLSGLTTTDPEETVDDAQFQILAGGINDLRERMKLLENNVTKPYQVSPQRKRERELLEGIARELNAADAFVLNDEA